MQSAVPQAVQPEVVMDKIQESWHSNMFKELLTSGASVAIATGATNPIDTVKVRIQMNNSAHGRVGMVEVFTSIVRNEGYTALFRGLTPALVRGTTYGGLRLGLYTPLKEALRDSETGSLSFGSKVAAGCTSGALAAAITNPTELVKTRLQAHGCAHSNPVSLIRDMVATGGVRSLWAGTTPSMIRAAALTASQVATYDVVKRSIMSATSASDGMPLHVATGAVTGLVTTTITAPVDVLKTKMFTAQREEGAGLWAATVKLAKEEGIAGFFKGWTANYARLGPQTLLTFLAAEQLRHLFGLDAL